MKELPTGVLSTCSRTDRLNYFHSWDVCTLTSLVKFMMKKIPQIQLSDVSFNLALILFKLYPFFACPNFPSM